MRVTRSLVLVTLVALVPLLAGCYSATPAPASPSAAPAGEAGQAAFASLQAVVAALEADATTDWSRVNVGALREHLLDMDDVALRARVSTVQVEGGFEAVATGEGRTVGALQRMVAEHAHMGLTSEPEWSASASVRSEGVVLRVTSSAPAEVARLRGLGFFGVMATGAHHEAHHEALARGETMHASL